MVLYFAITGTDCKYNINSNFQRSHKTLLTTKQSELLRHHPLSCVINSKAIAHYQNTKWLDNIYFLFLQWWKRLSFSNLCGCLYYLFWFKVKGFIWGREVKCHIVNICISLLHQSHVEKRIGKWSLKRCLKEMRSKFIPQLITFFRFPEESLRK